MQRDDSKLRVRRWRERQRAAKTAAAVTPPVTVTVAPPVTVTVTAPKKRKPKPPVKADDRFTEFWELYPRKVAKLAAERAWAKALRTAGAADILSGLRKQLADLGARDPQYCPHPATWLNAGRWADEPEPEPAFDDDLPF